MGFLKSVKDISANLEPADKIKPFMKNIGNGKDSKIMTIVLQTENLQQPITIKRIGKIDYSEPPSEDTREIWKNKYMFRPKGGNQSWFFSPVFLLGKVKKKELKTKFEDKFSEKIKKTIFNDLEKEEVIGQNNANKVKALLNGEQNQIINQIDEESSTFVVFAFEYGGKEYYAGDLDLFRAYFQKKMQLDMTKTKTERTCSICGKKVKEVTNLNKVFNFATFDKKGFIPGNQKPLTEKVFPICYTCYSKNDHAREIIEENYNNKYTIPGINIWIVPEINGNEHKKQSVNNNFSNYLNNHSDLIEKRMFKRMTRQNAALNFHILFLEKEPGKAKETILQMVEDVSPSYLNRLQQLWQENTRLWTSTKTDTPALDTAVQFLYRTFSTEIKHMDPSYRKQKAIELLAKLFRKERINIQHLKRQFVSKFPATMRDTYYYHKIRNQLRMIEFINAQQREVEKSET